MHTLKRVLLVGGILCVFLGLVLGMDSESVKNPISRILMMGGGSFIGVWVLIRFYEDFTRKDLDDELAEMRKERQRKKEEAEQTQDES